jgi:succinate dehydrogenase / fumarate reductase flavoprotein subunit
VFLDIAWIADKLPGAAEHIQRKLPSMYHQFRKLADIDITREPMEVGPTTHYAMGGIRVDADTQMSNVPGLYAAGECAAGLHGANRLGGNSLSDLLVFGKRAGEHAAQFAAEKGPGTINNDQTEEAARAALAPFGRSDDGGEGPYAVQRALQGTMQDHVGILRNEGEMLTALENMARLRAQAAAVAVDGNREYNVGWHTALDLDNLFTVAEAITRAAIERRESRGAHTRTDHPDKDPEAARYNLVVQRGSDGAMQVRREPISEMPQKLADIIEEMNK